MSGVAVCSLVMPRPVCAQRLPSTPFQIPTKPADISSHTFILHLHHTNTPFHQPHSQPKQQPSTMSSNDNNSSSSNNNNNAGSSGNNNSNKNAGDYPAAPLAPLPPTGLTKEVYLKVMADLGAEPAEWHGEAEMELAR